MSVRLYGRDVGHGSLAVVTRGFREALGERISGFVALDRGGGSEEDAAPPGSLARDGIFTGSLNMLHAMQRNAKHERHWVQFTPNSNYVPPNLLAAVLRLPNPHVISCSGWGLRVIASAIRGLGFTSVGGDYDQLDLEHPDGTRARIITARHGVSGFAPSVFDIDSARDDFTRGHFRVIHFSTTEGQRKGTLELIQAWIAWKNKPTKAQLLLVLDYHADAALRLRLLDQGIQPPDDVQFVPRANMSSEAMAKFLSHAHLLAAPSRGEGFGLTVLEARACGLPVIATVTTGHSAGHVAGAGVVPIWQPSDYEPIDDGPGATAPGLRSADITKSLEHAAAHWPQLSHEALQEAPAVAERWSWRRQLQPLLDAIDK